MCFWRLHFWIHVFPSIYNNDNPVDAIFRNVLHTEGVATCPKVFMDEWFMAKSFETESDF